MSIQDLALAALENRSLKRALSVWGQELGFFDIYGIGYKSYVHMP